MSWIPASIIILIILACLLQPWLFKMKAKRLPPGPKGFPIIGSLHLLKKLVHRDLHHLSQSYGPIMHMKLGLKSTIIVSSPHAAELFLKVHDPVFAGRPLPLTSNQMSYGRKDIAFAPYGSYWRSMRKMCTFELLTTLKINFFTSMRREELCLFIDRLRAAAKSRAVVDLSSQVSSLIVDVLCMMVFGKKFADNDLQEFKAAIREATFLAGAPNFGDFLPFIAFLDLQGLERGARAVTKVFDGFLDMIIEQRLESKDENKTGGSFVDVMLDLMGSREREYQIDRSSIKGVILDLFIGGVDSSSSIINWALSELIKHEDVMKKVQEELGKVVGVDRRVEESDLSELKYLEMVMKEAFRMHPPIPLIPRESMEDCIVNGYHIPKKSNVLINVWGMGRDPCTWFDPNDFFPERFLDGRGPAEMRGRRDFELIPFGFGRRGCPGLQLGLTLVPFILAQLVHCFDWKLPNCALPSQLNMSEEFGLTCSRVDNLQLIPIYRLPNS